MRMCYRLCDNVAVQRSKRVRASCKKCGKEFFAKPSHISCGFGKFCSRACSAANQRNGFETLCDSCGKKIYRSRKMSGRSKSGKFFCGKRCQTLWRNRLYTGERHSNWKHGREVYRSILVRGGREKICALCATRDERVLAAHHIDRNRLNNSLENLAWLCHNCHFLVHHYNAGRDRGLLKPRS